MQQFTFNVYLNDEQLAELDRFAAHISKDVAQPASREEAAAVCVVSTLDQNRLHHLHREYVWLRIQALVEQLARKHGLVISKDLPIEEE